MRLGSEVLQCHGFIAGGGAQLCPRALPADNNARVQAANEAHDSSAATAASRDAHQLLHAVQSEEGFTMQVPPHSRAQRWRV